MLRTYFEFEREQKYAQIYALLSQRRKQYLRKFDVRNAAQYRRLRESSEASWSDFVIEHQSAQSFGIISFTGKARVEESGEAKMLPFTATLIKENGNWKVDDWKY